MSNLLIKQAMSIIYGNEVGFVYLNHKDLLE